MFCRDTRGLLVPPPKNRLPNNAFGYNSEADVKVAQCIQKRHTAFVLFLSFTLTPCRRARHRFSHSRGVAGTLTSASARARTWNRLTRVRGGTPPTAASSEEEADREEKASSKALTSALTSVEDRRGGSKVRAFRVSFTACVCGATWRGRRNAGAKTRRRQDQRVTDESTRRQEPTAPMYPH